MSDGTAEAQAREERREKGRWVQYDAPVFVWVEPDEDGMGTEITRVILVTDLGAMYPARDERGHFLVPDSRFELVSPSRRDGTIDGLRTASSAADDRHRWPETTVIATGDGWDAGLDPRGFPDYYLTDKELADEYGDAEDRYADDDDPDDD